MHVEKRLSGLDALRGLAAMSVVLHHYTSRYTEITGNPLSPSFSLADGHYGVELFFIISGFVISMTLDRSRHAYDFVASRVARLYPAFLACLLLTLIVLSSSDLRGVAHPDAYAVLANLTMIPAFFRSPEIDASYWSLLFEVMFYVLAATGHFLAGSRRTEFLCVGWLAFALLCRAVGPTVIPWKLWTAAIVEYAPLFVIGILLYRIRSKQAAPSAYLLIGACLMMCKFGPHWSSRPISASGYIGLIAAFTLLVWLATWERSPLAAIAPLVFLGDVSYPLYLVHQNIGYVAIERLTGLGVGSNASVIIAIAIAIALAYVISKCVEKPAQRTIRSVFARHRSRLLGAAA